MVSASWRVWSELHRWGCGPAGSALTALSSPHGVRSPPRLLFEKFINLTALFRELAWLSLASLLSLPPPRLFFLGDCRAAPGLLLIL